VGEPALVSRLHWIGGASHNDLYYKDEYVTPANVEYGGRSRRLLALCEQ